MPTAFVTGCASGFGHALTAELLAAGWRVVATDPSVEDWPARLGAPRPELTVLALDVRDERAVRAAAAAVSHVDLLVNNAGVAAFGPQEELDLERVREMFEINVLGPARVTQALLPALRRARGMLVQISSVAGKVAFAGSGFYAATKHALEAMTEALVQETAPFGIRIRLVQPGSFATRLQERAAEVSPPPGPTSPYAELSTMWEARLADVLDAPQDPRRVAQAILRSWDDPAPFARIVVGADAARILALREALGPDAWARLIADRHGLADAPHGPGDVPGPAELLALGNHDAQWSVAEAAWAAGYLDHWRDDPVGQEALARLARRAGG